MPKSKSEKTIKRAVDCLLLLHGKKDLKEVIIKLYGGHTGEKITRFKRDVYPLIKNIVTIEPNTAPRFKDKRYEKRYNDWKKALKKFGETNDSEGHNTLPTKGFYDQVRPNMSGPKKTRGKQIFIDPKKIGLVWRNAQKRFIDSITNHENKQQGGIRETCPTHKNKELTQFLHKPDSQRIDEDCISPLSKNNFFLNHLRSYLIWCLSVKEAKLDVENILGRDFAFALCAITSEKLIEQIKSDHKVMDKDYVNVLDTLQHYQVSLSLLQNLQPTHVTALKNSLSLTPLGIKKEDLFR